MNPLRLDVVLVEDLRRLLGLDLTPEQRVDLLRERAQRDGLLGVIDASVPPENRASFLAGLRRLEEEGV